MKVKIKQPYNPVDFFMQLEKYTNDLTPLEIIFPDECTDAFSAVFNLNSLLNVEKIEVPWNFGSGSIFAKCNFENSTLYDNQNSESTINANFQNIYFNNLKLLELSADEILEKNSSFIMQNGIYANNLLKTVLTLPFPSSLKQIKFRACPKNKTPLFDFKEGQIISSDMKFVYKNLLE